jgi:hypothetical protein
MQGVSPGSPITRKRNKKTNSVEDAGDRKPQRLWEAGEGSKHCSPGRQQREEQD